MMRTLIGIVGSSKASEVVMSAAYEVGKAVMNSGYSLVCGGLGGVMEAACRGAFEEVGPNSGRIIGILPGSQKKDANPYVDIVIPTGFGYARNFIILLPAKTFLKSLAAPASGPRCSRAAH